MIYHPNEIQCPTHGRIQEQIPWAESFARVTYCFEYALLRLCQQMTQKAAASFLRIHKSTLSSLLHRIITRMRAGHKIRGILTLGVDEIAYSHGHKYATIVYDLDRSKVVWVGPGKGAATLEEFFKTRLSEHQRNRVKYACCDMAEAFIGMIEKWLPNATLVLDRLTTTRRDIQPQSNPSRGDPKAWQQRGTATRHSLCFRQSCASGAAARDRTDI